MSYKCFIGGKLIETTLGNDYTYAQEDIVYNCLKPINIKGDEKGVSFNKPEDPPKKKAETKVKEIELLTDLDDGSANDGSGGLQKGIVYGKSYTFKVKTYTAGEPKSKSLVKWMYKYHNLLENKWVEVYSKKTGENYTIHFNEEEMCGRFVYVIAYIEDEKEEGELKVWKHNRFRMLARQLLIIETGLRANISSAIDQGGSSLCGIAVVGYYLARDKPKVYNKFVLDMHRKGEVTIEANKYKIEIDKDEHLIKYKTTDKKYPDGSLGLGKMLTADFVFLVTIKDFLNNIFDYNPDDEHVGEFVEGGTGLTLPGEVASIFKNIANYSEVINDTNLITSKWQSASNSADELEKKLNDGYRIGLLIDSDNFTKNSKSKFTIPTHWVGLLKVANDKKSDQISITVFTWSSIRTWTVSYSVFRDGYFGYVGGK